MYHYFLIYIDDGDHSDCWVSSAHVKSNRKRLESISKIQARSIENRGLNTELRQVVLRRRDSIYWER